MAAWPMACAKWLLPVPPGPRNNASSRLPMKAHVAKSKTRLRFIFGLKLKSKWSSVFCGSRKAACLRRRSSRRSPRRVSSSATGFGAHQFGGVGITLLRHHRRAGGELVRQLDKAGERRGPDHDFLGQPRQVHRRDRSGGKRLQDEV